MLKQHSRSLTIALILCFMPVALLASTITEGWNTFGLSSASSGSAKLLTENEQYIEVEWTWSQFKVTTLSTPAGPFQKLSLGVDLPASRQALGEPELPISVEMINYPAGSYGRVEVLASEWQSFENVRPYPVQFPARDGLEDPPFAFDADAYESLAAIPAEISGVTTPKGWGGLDVGSLWASPFRYTPSLKKLEVATSIKVRVWFEHDDAFHAVTPNSPSPWITKAQQASLLNPPINPPEINDFDEPEPTRLLVVTRQAALATAQPLIDLHKNTGLKTEIWVLEGDVTPRQIRDRIRDLYDDGLQYVLFVGDGDQASPDIPMQWFDDAYPGPDLGESACGSDSWYTCLDGDDRDGFVDHLPDIALGRLVYNNVNALNQLQTQVDKLTDYIDWDFEDQNSDWLRRNLMVAHSQNDANHDYIPCKTTIIQRDYRFPHGEWVWLPGNLQGVNNARIIEQVNHGVGIFNYRGHGDETMWWRWNGRENFTSANVAQMDNRQKPFILFSSACLTGNIYDYVGTCLMESFQKHPNGGSLCVNGCTLSTITLGNSYSDIAVFDAMFEEGIVNIGYANNAATVSTVLYFDANAPNGWRGIGYINMRAYLWLGDASVNYRLADPAILSMDVSPLVPEGTQQLEVTVASADVPFAGALITARTADDAIYTLATTDADGHALLVFDAPLEMQETLLITASNREAKPVSSPVLVANGLGVIEGRVVRRTGGAAIAGASVDLTRFHVIDETDQNGVFRIEGIPSGRYELVASIRGMIPQVLNVEVVENLVTQANFDLAQSQMVIEPDSIEVFIDAESESQQRLVYRNRGDAVVEWTAKFQPDIRRQPFDLVMEFLPGWDNGDSRIYGAVFIEDKFYVAGGNNNADPNFIYVFDRDGVELVQSRFEQPSAGNGFRDLDWDGEYLYGAANRDIKVFDLEGDLVETIQGPYDPSRAIAIDPDGSIWVGNNRSAIVKINRQGQVLNNIPVNFYVMGMTWYPEQKDGYNLLIWGRSGVNGVELYGANPETGRMILLQNLLMNENEIAVEGLYVTSDYDSRDWMMIGMVGMVGQAGLVEAQTVKVWQLDPRTSWITFDPLAGSLEPDQQGEIALTLNSHNYLPGTTLAGNALFTTNNLGEIIALPIELNIDPNSVDREDVVSAPSDFALTKVYPNPFNAMLRLDINLPEAGILKVGVYDLQGRLVIDGTSSYYGSGTQTISVNGEGLSNGLYIIRAESNGRTAVAKAALLK